ncbi:heparan-alpha-glucosaminide N-acetyltransferase domain-containing protein [Kocuria palustris]|uniref:heparan-alpha-glucosaminide N-acetyltransferase domain-containing protein n=1 Tax=Kocuria palustris TaxID=71999 RepID=UPI002301E6DA|nr:heparan-alpha-glucosaminide N-acetyltransferase domain-containing protein [Kocuria palustris]
MSSFDRQADLAGPIVPGAVSAGPGASGRLLGIDLARAVALLGMMATHTMDLVDAAGDPQPVGLIAGKAAALFAVLAGFSVKLSTRRYGRWREAAASLAVRGVLIAILGLVLGSLSSSIAVVLVNYGVLFLLAPLVLRLPARWLAATTVLWLVASPVASHLIRDGLGLQRAVEAPELSHLAQPVELALGVLLTGYYPVLQWMGYLLAGLLLARLDWRSAATAAWVGAVGALLAAAAWVSSQLLLSAGGHEALERAGSGLSPLAWGSPYAAQTIGSHGTTPTTTWWWLVTVGPHSSTTFDLVFTSGIAAAVIAVCVLICLAIGERTRLLMPVLAAGSMPLSMYTLHVILSELTDLYVLQVLLLLGLAALWRAGGEGPGPLESLVSGTVRLVGPRR